MCMGMLDRFTKKATANAIETTKETLNDKLDTYSGIIKLFLTIAVIGFGAKKVNDHNTKKTTQSSQSLPQQPIVINNYFDRGYIPNGKQRKGYQQH